MSLTRLSTLRPGKTEHFQTGLDTQRSYFFDATPHGATKLTIIDEIDVRGIRAWLFYSQSPSLGVGLGQTRVV